MLAQSLVTLVVPLAIMALAVPMILEKVPRNCIYGFRTPYTMSSDAAWYRANKISGIALVLAGAFWLLAGQILGRVMDSQRAVLRLTSLLGAGALMAGCLVSVWLTYRKQ
jgi:SdpI/YfhL protein family